jgi:uncharacterized protein YgiM (DUF1202 family)
MFVIPVFMVVCIFSAWFEHHLYEKEHPAIVFNEMVTVRNEPRENASEAFVLHEGTKVYILETLDNWNKIQLADESEGWIMSDAIKPLKP